MNNLMNEAIISRYDALAHLVAGYDKTGGQPLIGFDGIRLEPFYACDDIGMYCLIPKLVNKLDISLNQGIYLFFYCLIGIAVVLGIWGFSLLYQSWIQRGIATAGLIAIGLLAAKYIDTSVPQIWCVHSAYVVCAISIIPLSLYCYQRNKVASWLISAVVSGMILGLCHYIRAFSGLPVVVTMLTLLALSSLRNKEKFMIVVATIVGALIPIAYFSWCYHSYVAYAAVHLPGLPINLKNHPLWHTIYVGFGYITNNFGITFDDGCGYAKVRETVPNFVLFSKEYETALRNAVIDMCLTQPLYLMKVMFAKLGVFVFYLLCIANGGLVAAYFYRKPWQVDVALLMGLIASTIFGFVAIPESIYILSFITFAWLYAIVSVNYVVEWVMAHSTSERGFMHVIKKSC